MLQYGRIYITDIRVLREIVHFQEETLHRIQRNQQTQHHHFRLDGGTIHTAHQHATQHIKCYQYFIL